jgi:glycosyltransferase involved in cell wall biosynthesis
LGSGVAPDVCLLSSLATRGRGITNSDGCRNLAWKFSGTYTEQRLADATRVVLPRISWMPHSAVDLMATHRWSELMTPITEPYLLCVSVPVSVDSKGRRWTDDLWAKDLALHLDYLADVTLASPCARREPGQRDVPLDLPPFDQLKFVDLPYCKSYGEALRTFPRYLSCLWCGARGAAIVHSGFGGWPLTTGWFIAPIGRIQKKCVIVNVESSFWRMRGDRVPLRKRVLSFVMERLTRFAVKIAHVRLFTSRAYAAEFLSENSPRAFVVPASWVDEEWILSETRAVAEWEAKSGPARLLFAGRLIADKGVPELLEAVDLAAASRPELEVTIVGDGPLRAECIRAAAGDHGSVRLRYLDPVPYGEPFLALLRRQDAVLLPSRSDEQPRLLFDAYSQAVPVIGSSTGGIREGLEPEVSGRLVPPGDSSALAEAMVWAGKSRQELNAMGMSALAWVRGRTHRAMHQRRYEILRQVLAEHTKS